MPTPLFVAEANGSRLYKIGRVGFDTGTSDVGGVFTGVLKTEKLSPAGEDGLCYFRRVIVRAWRTGAYTVTLKCWVDGVRTKVYGTDGAASDQTVTIAGTAPAISPDEAIVEASIAAQGTYLEVELSIASNAITGVFLPESLEVHYLPIRPAKSRPTAEST